MGGQQEALTHLGDGRPDRPGVQAAARKRDHQALHSGGAATGPLSSSSARSAMALLGTWITGRQVTELLVRAQGLL